MEAVDQPPFIVAGRISPNLDYTASQGGIEKFMKSAAIELDALGITVNCVALGAIATERTSAEAPDYESA